MTVALIVAALLVGYALGRVRLGRRLDDWNWRRVIHGAGTANVGDVALFAVLHPGKAAQSWRRRNDTPAELPAPVVHERWAVRADG